MLRVSQIYLQLVGIFVDFLLSVKTQTHVSLICICFVVEVLCVCYQIKHRLRIFCMCQKTVFFIKIHINQGVFLVFHEQLKEIQCLLTRTLCMQSVLCNPKFCIHNCIPSDRLLNHEDAVGIDAEELVNLEVLYNLPFQYNFIKLPQYLFFVHIVLH